jgi:hypothetical protein
MSPSPFSGIARRWHRLTTSSAEHEAETLAEQAQRLGATPIAEAHPGHEYVFAGVLASVTVRPDGASQGFDAELFDGTGRVRLVWLGRRRIPGIDPGRRMSVTGRVVRAPGAPIATVFNPRYTLLPGESA